MHSILYLFFLLNMFSIIYYLNYNTEFNVPVYTNEWLSYYLTPSQQLYIYIVGRTQYFWGGYGVSRYFQQYFIYRGRQFYLWRKPEYPVKTTVLSQGNRIMLYRVHLAWARFERTTLVVIGSFNPIYHNQQSYSWK